MSSQATWNSLEDFPNNVDTDVNYPNQGCHSHKISKFPDFSLTYLTFSLTTETQTSKN